MAADNLHTKNYEIRIPESNIILSRTQGEDEELKAIMQSPEVLPFVSETRTPEFKRPDFMIFRIQDSNRIIGELELRNIRPVNSKAELSMALIPGLHSKGIGQKIFVHVLRFGFETLDLNRLEAEIFEYNKIARHIIESFGFVKEGARRKARWFDGRFYDIICYGLLREEWRESQRKNNAPK